MRAPYLDARASAAAAAVLILIVAGCGPAGYDVGDDLSQVSIERSALGSEFLLHASGIDEELGTPFFKGLRSRIVYFEQRGEQLYMFEAADYALAGGELSGQRLLLARFPISRQDGDAITFDFNAGMTNLYFAEDWFASDYESYLSQPRAASAPIETSLIEFVRIDRDRLVIKQVGKLTPDDDNRAFSMLYYLSPYQPDPSYQPVASPADFDNVAFFEVAPKMADASTPVLWASRFHPQKPIVFAISANPFSIGGGRLLSREAGGRPRIVATLGRAFEVEGEPSPSGRWLTFRGETSEGDYIHRQVFLLDRLRGELYPIRPGRARPLARPLRDLGSVETYEAVGETSIRWIPGIDRLVLDSLLLIPGFKGIRFAGDFAI